MFNAGFGAVTTRERPPQLSTRARRRRRRRPPVIANPDLVERWAGEHPENVPDPATFYAAGAEGYTDYPFLAAA